MDASLTLALAGATLRLTGTLVACGDAAPARAVGGSLTARFSSPDDPPSEVGGDTASLDLVQPVAADELSVAVPEETTLRVWLEPTAPGAPLTLYHADPVVSTDLRSEPSGVTHGRLAVGAHAGRTRFEVWRGGDRLGTLEIEIVPTKASAADVSAMRAAVEAAWAGVSLAAIRPATAAFAAAEAAPRPAVVWLALLDRALADLPRALAEVRRRPLREVRRAPELRRTATLGRMRSSEASALARRAGADPAAWPARVEATVATETLDTPSVRWVAGRLNRAVARLRALRRLAEPSRSARRDALAARLADADRELQAMLRGAPLAEADGPPPRVPPLALRRRPELRRVYDALRALDRGLDLAEGDLRVALRDLAMLYETWATLTVVRATARALGAEPPPLALRRSGIDVTLRPGTLTFDGPVRARLAVQPRFGGGPALLVQRPDLVLTLHGPGGTRRLALDAKYRRDDSPRALRRFQSPAPPADALGTLHRYRDAILGPHGERGWIDAAVALFPHRPTVGAPPSRLVGAVAGLGVGALPLLPGETAALDATLARLVSEVA